MTIDSLTTEWREQAASLRAWSATSHADILEKCAAELEARLREYALEALTLEEAVKESGYGYASLQTKLASGELENVGKKGAPLVRRGDLPRKGGRLTAAESPGIADAILLRRLK